MAEDIEKTLQSKHGDDVPLFTSQRINGRGRCKADMVTKSLSSLPNRHQVAPGPVSRRRGINGKQTKPEEVNKWQGSSWLHPEGLLDPSTTMRCEPSLGDKWPNIWQDKWQKTLQNKHGDEVPLFTSQSAPGFPGTGEQKAGDR
ncbi:hypothetical protein N7519_008771 [Penicillium mononematosum]|uniref:uncharacterized protein n=1 Tax=Penicillium mononematosum TaxID=268346 RepID=UPI002549BCCA|nr:uncharacterized protein N7519_008771 [Penicillium mononematosum]KAJ6178310.1 hypothetical protein N7519_008771 [Penicillium mononematosum]